MDLHSQMTMYITSAMTSPVTTTAKTSKWLRLWTRDCWMQAEVVEDFRLTAMAQRQSKFENVPMVLGKISFFCGFLALQDCLQKPGLCKQINNKAFATEDITTKQGL